MRQKDLHSYDSDSNTEEFELHFDIDDDASIQGSAPPTEHKERRIMESESNLDALAIEKESYVVKIKKGATKVAPFFTNPDQSFPFTQLSDHYGIETTIRISQKAK